ncbi:MAG: iron-containing alcohol dehydrogenase [Chloroflexi bacterium]|nr:iron-containing alcohol dehydrogenase [Chloroflexota bacterium]
MINFEFATATRIIFGNGSAAQIGSLAAGLGKRALLVVGKSQNRAQPAFSSLADAGVESVPFSVSTEPTIDIARQGTALARHEGCDLVIAFGGGSSIDTGKAIAAMLTNTGDPLDYLEVIGGGQAIGRRSAPFIAVPTTAGAGSEVTRNAVLASPQHQVKVSLRSPLMLPTIALVDAELTYSVPPDITATTGLDALTQVIEPYVSWKANPIIDALCVQGIRRAARSLRRAYEDPNDTAAREDMALASLYGGLALANAGLGAVHGFAAPFGGMLGGPHGGICAALLPHVTTINVQAMQEREPDNAAVERYQQVAALLIGSPQATAEEGAVWLTELCQTLNIPPLHTYGLTPDHYPDLIQKAHNASSMKGNPIVLSDEELVEILEMAC